MILFIIGITLSVIAAVGILGCENKATRMGGIALAVVATVLIALSCVAFIPTGYTGIITTFGKVENTTLDAGPHFKPPWQGLVKMDNRVRKAEVQLACFSSDIQEVNASVTVGYRINQANAMTIYKEIGKDYVDIVVMPQISEAVKSVIAQYDANSLMESRDQATSRICDKLSNSLSKYNVDLSEVSVTDIDFTDTFTNAVEAKVEAQQKAEQAEAAAKQLKVEAQAQADADVIKAQAEAQKAKVEADAELYVSQQKAEANRVLNESLSENLLDYYRITEVDGLWNGALPVYVGGESSIPVLGSMEK